MKIKLGKRISLILLLCTSLLIVAAYCPRMAIWDTWEHAFSRGHVTEFKRVGQKSVMLDIRCVGADKNQAEDLFCMRPNRVPATSPTAYGPMKTSVDVLPCNDCLGRKETFYWSRKRYGYEHSMKERPPCNFRCLQHMFSVAAQKIERTTTHTGYHNMITGDGTPSDFSDFRGWPKIPQNAGLEKPVILTPHLMRHVYTDPKFILILRNPTDRLYSDYMMMADGSAADFHEVARQSIRIEENCMKNHTVEQCLYSLELARRLQTRIFLGCYSVYMREWLKVFPREQFLILRTEDHDKDPKARLRKVYNYLKLNYTEAWLSSIAKVSHRVVGKRKLKRGPMLPKPVSCWTIFTGNIRWIWQIYYKTRDFYG